jgi:hypothetical protein
MKRQFVSYDEFKPQVDESWWQATLRDEQLTANEEILRRTVKIAVLPPQ